MLKQLIKVTQDDINNGEPQTANSCPIALAIQRRGWKYPRVTSSYIEVPDGPLYADNTANPRSVRRFIKAFDAGKPVKPFNFFLVLGKRW